MIHDAIPLCDVIVILLFLRWWLDFCYQSWKGVHAIDDEMLIIIDKSFDEIKTGHVQTVITFAT